jgi:hypothetical protein
MTFGLTKKTVQVIFYDKSEIILQEPSQTLTYHNKHGQTSLYDFQTVYEASSADLETRLKYLREIMETNGKR